MASFGTSRSTRLRLARTYLLAANVLKASEDKTFPGAIVASIASPWGQAVSAGDPNNTYFGSYREVFARATEDRDTRAAIADVVPAALELPSAPPGELYVRDITGDEPIRTLGAWGDGGK